MPVSSDQFRLHHLQRQARRTQMLGHKRQQIIEALHTVASIAHQFGAQQVLVFGSILQEKKFHNRSDLDILVIGMPLSGWLPTLLALEQVPALSDVAIDLKRAEELSEELVELIKNEGQKILPTKPNHP